MAGTLVGMVESIFVTAVASAFVGSVIGAFLKWSVVVNVLGGVVV